MRKFLFFLLLLPVIGSLGHDVYIYQQNPDKGFRFWDLGALWDKYHKESHDQWKIKLDEAGNTVAALVPDAIKDMSINNETLQETTSEIKQVYGESFEQTNANDEDVKITAIKKENVKQTNMSALQRFIGFVLEQKAALVFAVIAFGSFILNMFCKIIFSAKAAISTPKKGARGTGKGKSAKGEYKFSRK